MTWSPGVKSVTASPTASDDAGALVTQNGRRTAHHRNVVEPLDEMEVAMTDAGGGGVDQDFPRAGRVDLDLLDGEWLANLVEHCCAHFRRLPCPSKFHFRGSARGGLCIPATEDAG